MAKRAHSPDDGKISSRPVKKHESSPPSTPPQSVPGDKLYPPVLGPQPPPVPKSGRPTHEERGQRTDVSKPAPLSGLVPSSPHTPPRKSKKKDTSLAFSPHTSKLLSFTTGLPIHLQASPQRPVITSKRAKGGSKQSGLRPALHHIKHQKEKGWTSAGHTTTFEAYKHFEKWARTYGGPNAHLFRPTNFR
ncbi:hypothetical protein C8R45DRAFT_944774 [Mycena sanguinolenta]|nr:hypothetical protein C8R45DRAFT_944774 [Mycena sanguinolenta]